MNRYWLRIIAGALAIFGVGYVLFAVGERTVERVEEITDGTGSISVPLFGLLEFRVNGERAGSIREITVERDAPDRVRALQVIVRRDSGDTATLAPCTFTLRDPEQIDENAEFVCLTVDSMIAALQPFGEVQISGPGAERLVRPIVLPQDVIDRWREHHGDPIDPGLGDRMSDSLTRHVDSIASTAVSEALDAAARATAEARVRAEGSAAPTSGGGAPEPPAPTAP